MNNKYYFIRHWQTDYNARWIMHWQLDVPLNETWIKQSEKIATDIKELDFDVVVSSTLTRARYIAQKILEWRQSEVIEDSRLMELYKWKLEWVDVNSEKLLKDENPIILEQFWIETKIDFQARVSELMQELELRYNWKTILIVAHSWTIKMCFFHFYPPINKQLHIAYYEKHIKNCVLYTLNDILWQ